MARKSNPKFIGAFVLGALALVIAGALIFGSGDYFTPKDKAVLFFQESVHVDAPSAYGPRKTLYNRFVRWAAKGVWEDIFHALASAGGPPEQVLIDSSAVKAHRCAAGGKRMARPVCKQFRDLI